MFKRIYGPVSIVVLFYTAIIVTLVLIKNYGMNEILALILAFILALANMFYAVFQIEKYMKLTDTDFVKNYFRGMAFRLVILLAIFFTTLLIIPANHFVFITAFFILYFILQIIEVTILHRTKNLGL